LNTRHLLFDNDYRFQISREFVCCIIFFFIVGIYYQRIIFVTTSFHFLLPSCALFVVKILLPNTILYCIYLIIMVYNNLF